MNHNFNVNLAKEYGILEAILINNIWYWTEKNKANDKHYHDGYYWTYNSAKAFLTLFPYATQKQIQYALKKLKNEGIIITGNYNISSFDKTTWYAITEKGLSIIHNCNIDLTKWDNREGDFVTPIPYINTNINTNINKKENNINIKESEIDVDFDKSTCVEDEKKADEYDKSYGGKIDQDNFNLIWDMYPKKVGKIEAFNQFCKWTNGRKVKVGKTTKTIKISAEQIYDFVEEYAKKVKSYTDTKYIKNGATFFGLSLMDYLEDYDI